MIAEPESNVTGCPHCGSPVGDADTFCGQCGKELSAIATPIVREDVFITLTPALLFYLVTLILLMVYKFTSSFPDGFEGQLAVSIIDVLIVIGFSIYGWQEVVPLLSLKRIKPGVLLLTILGALAGSVVISVLARLINISISDDVFYNPYLFQDTSSPLLISIVFICVQPAIFEELAFRGFLFNNLQKVTSTSGAIYITGFVFGLMHLSFISMIWLVPIGLAFAFLRLRYHTLWYGIIGHFTYNLGITLLEFYRVI